MRKSKTQLWEAASAKMAASGLSEEAIAAFNRSLGQLAEGSQGQIAESEIAPVKDVPALEGLPVAERVGDSGVTELSRQLVVIKLNGGLGTSMGLDRAKSLLAVKGGLTFLDYIARQVLHWRERGGLSEGAFYLMNSFSTREDSLEYLRRHYPALVEGERVDFLQNKVPKLDAETLEPISWPEDRELEWCPPGHGDLYVSLAGTGLLDRLLERGMKYAFISNADNLGASIDPRILLHFAQSGDSFLMEVSRRTESDRKGGHLAKRLSDGRLLLRESAQCSENDEASFQDIERHGYFNTNNLWVRLDHLRDALQREHGSLALPLIVNRKTVDPTDENSPPVIQLETAMGAAIECFDRTGALLVPRSRFAPVKKTADLLAVRSDAYQETEDARLVLHEERQGRPPKISLDEKYFGQVTDFEARFGELAPSLKGCDALTIEGNVKVAEGVICLGRVKFTNRSRDPEAILEVPSGVYENREVSKG